MEQRLTTEEICTKLKPVFGKKIDEIYLKYALADSKEERDEIEHILNALYHKNLSELLNKKVLLEPPDSEVMKGGYPLAVVGYADKKLFPFSLREQDWVRHVCVSGMSGSGKTTIGFHIIKNFLEKGKPFLIFDWKKSFRPLLSVDSEIMNFTIGNDKISNLFKMNINEPPKQVDPKEWINVLCDLIVESFFASYGVHKVLLETLDEAFKEWGIYNGSQNYPTWHHIKWRLEQKIEKASSRESAWIESALRIASVLTFGSFGKVCNYKGEGSMNVQDLLDRKVIFELNSLGNIEKKFFCEFILTYIYKLKKATQRGISEGFKHAILVDEAHNIFLKDKTNFVNESITDMVYREMREYGTSLICLDQHISKLSDTVAGNSACHIAFQQQLPQDIQTISGIMQLFDRKQFFTMLPVGSAIVKLSERYSRPFLIEVAPVDLRSETVSDKQVADRMNAIFEIKKLENGSDEKFRKKLIDSDPLQEKLIEIKKEREKPRVSNHALYNGELEEFKKTKSDFKRNGSLLNRNDENEIKTSAKLPKYRVENSAKLEKNNIGDIREMSQKDKEGVIEKTAEIGSENLKSAEIKKNIKEFANEGIVEGLNGIQRVLHEFAEKKIKQGWDIRQVDKFLEERKNQGSYSLADISKVINCILKNRFEEQKFFADKFEKVQELDSLNEIVTEELEQKQKVYKEDGYDLRGADEEVSDEEKRFLAFLQTNPYHEHSCVEFYKQVKLSARKGTKIKNQLIEKGLIKVNEEKNKKGWKKIIRLA